MKVTLKEPQPKARELRFEVGNVYLKNRPRILLLAVSETLLVYYRHGVLHELCPETKKGIHTERETSVGELCEFWGVELSVLNEITAKYIQPASNRDTKPKQKRRHGKRGSAEEELDRQKLLLRRRFHTG